MFSFTYSNRYVEASKNMEWMRDDMTEEEITHRLDIIKKNASYKPRGNAWPLQNKPGNLIFLMFLTVHISLWYSN